MRQPQLLCAGCMVPLKGTWPRPALATEQAGQTMQQDLVLCAQLRHQEALLPARAVEPPVFREEAVEQLTLATMATISALISALRATLKHYGSLYSGCIKTVSFLLESAFGLDSRALAEVANLESPTLLQPSPQLVHSKAKRPPNEHFSGFPYLPYFR